MQYIHGGWNHIFEHDRSPTDLRICFDKEQNKLVAMEIMLNAGGNAWPTRAEMLDVEDSLKNANEAALESPDDYGLMEADTLPDWAIAFLGSFPKPVSPDEIEAVKAYGFKVHLGTAEDGEELEGRWWWTITREDWKGIESSVGDFATEAEAWEDAVTEGREFLSQDA